MTQGRFNASDLSLAGARHRGVVTLAALALAAALAAAGCGGNGGNGGNGGSRLSKTQYEARIQKDGADIRDAFTPLSRRTSSLDELAKNIKAGQDKLRSAADDLGSITPPSEIEGDNKLLVAGLRKLVALLEPLRKGAAKGDPKLVQKAVQELQQSKALQDAQKATQDMKKKGYKLGTLAE
jgi:hypothetical protein